MTGRIRLLWAGLLAAATTRPWSEPQRWSKPASRSGRSSKELTMRRIRLLWAGLVAAVATVAAIAAPTVLAGFSALPAD